VRRQILLHGDLIALGGLLIAWVGVWLPWIPDATVGLTQNGPDLAEWSGFLLDVRLGPLSHTPDLLRLAFGLATAALCVSAALFERPWLRWATRALALLLAVVLMPPYPQVLDGWRSESYGLRFVIAAGTLLALPVSGLTDSFPATIRRGLAIGLSMAALLVGWLSYTALREPFAAHYDHSIAPGLGVSLFVVGLLLAVIGGAAALIGPRRLGVSAPT
jgi:hypothetical protein